ncbi:unnamed protein product [Schistocephalus solidus]|uniref:Uncharacterized protein n=1 Tax=Schistocephalus solidus TaxID=70667 RepID=A0A3P7DL63_SCHSO|nr:unnamed protein product [Schistocephalus solidus]
MGHLEEVDAAYVSLWSGRPMAKLRDPGVAFAIPYDIGGRLSCLPQSINDQLMTRRLPLRRSKLATLTIANAYLQ